MGVPLEPDLTSEERQAVALALSQFNRRLFFECHETLEKVWLRLQAPARNFVQGLIQVSVGFHHLDRGNRVGAKRTFARAWHRLEGCPAQYLGFDVAHERALIHSLLQNLDDKES